MDFPIYRHLMTGGEYYVESSLDKAGGYMTLTSEGRVEMKKVVLVKGLPLNVDEAIDAWIKGPEYIMETVGPQMPPFPAMWIEWETHLPADDNGPALDSYSASMVYCADDQIAYTCFNKDVYGKIRMISPDLISEVGETGQMLNIGFRSAREAWTPTIELDFDKDKDVIRALIINMPSLYTIGMMNCKNVSTTIHQHRSRSANPRIRKAEPKFEYHTIVLPQPKSRTGGGGGGSHGSPALHKVRGHFKRYTEDAPLFGKHVGTYWWPWQVRGTTDSGVVVSNYEVKES